MFIEYLIRVHLWSILCQEHEPRINTDAHSF